MEDAMPALMLIDAAWSLIRLHLAMGTGAGRLPGLVARLCRLGASPRVQVCPLGACCR